MSLDDPEYCRKRAREMRDLAAQIGFVDAKDQLLEMAEDYDRLAKTAEEQSKNAPRPPR